MRVIEAAGTPHEIGFAIGSQATELVQSAVELICHLGLSKEDLERKLGPVERRLVETFPHVLEEAEGLAEGAGIDRREALVLSVVSDMSGRLPSYCSLSGLRGTNGVLVGKNLDSTREMRALQVLERLAPAAGLRFVHITTAGAMWTDGGVNEAGLALANASLESATSNPDGVPDGILAREILATCHDVPEAIAFAGRFGIRTLGANILVADAADRMAVIEKLPGGQAVREARPIIAGNHALAPEVANLMSPANSIQTNSERRLASLGRAVRSRTAWAMDEVKELLADHEGGICQHGQDGLWTIGSLVLVPVERLMCVAAGAPCETRFEEVALDTGTRNGKAES